TLVATSVPDWPGWRVEVDGRPVDPVAVNHAFVGFWLTAGRHDVRVAYRPASVRWGFIAFAIGLAACGGLALARRRISRFNGGNRALAVS
ncbi:MAG TPA: YfhO family protein, partial [bacterium]|nr:YfhO family protein [bacterium]